MPREPGAGKLPAMEFLEVEHLALARRRPRLGWLRPGFETEPLIEDLCFSVARRESLAVVAETREALCALALAILKAGPVESGTIRFAGIPVLTFDPERFRAVRRRLQGVFPEGYGQLSPGLTVREAFREVLSVWHRRATREERARLVDSVMVACGLPEAVQDLYPAELDAVERQLVALARALLPGPELLVCLGLTEGLDAVQRAELINRLRHLREEFRLTLLVLTDDLAAACRLADTVAVLHRGRLVEQADAVGIATRPAHDHTRRLVACAA